MNTKRSLFLALAFVAASADFGKAQFILDPKERARYQQMQATMAAGPYIAAATKALPKSADFPRYNVKTTTTQQGGTCTAVRRVDMATVAVSLLASSNQEVVRIICSTGISGDTMGKLPQGSPSGRKLGEQSWQSWASTPSDTKQTGYFLQVQDGPSVFSIRFDSHIGQDKKGRLQYKPVTQADRLFCEHIARLTLRRLRALKLTHDTYKPDAKH